MKIKQSYIWWGLGAVVIVSLLFSGRFLSSTSKENPNNANLSNRELAMLCAAGMAENFHIHPNLQIIINGEIQGIPKNIGVKGQCMHPLHTHETDGTLHVEAPVQRDFTLGDFFAVWDKPFTKDQILDMKADGANGIRVTVNGNEVNTFENTVLKDKDRIIITYGSK